MVRDIQKLTQNERYDLKRKQVMEEKEAYTNSSLENFTEHCFSSRLIDRLTAENQRLKKQLKDYEKALKDYADGNFYEADINLLTNPLTNKEEVFSVDIQDKKGNVIYTKAQETLKKWEIE